MKQRQVIPRREHIPVGRENAVTRAELMDLWDMSDREVRETIATMRILPTDDPYAILSSSHNPPGYWRSDGQEELERYVQEQRARARNVIKNTMDARRVLENGQQNT